MGRGLVLAVVILMLLGASVASASDWYIGARFGGMSNYWLYPSWYKSYEGEHYPHLEDYFDHTDDYGLFDFREMTVGLRKGLWAGELGFGLANGSWTHDYEDEYWGDGTFTEKVSWRVISLAGLYQMIEPDPIELNLGLRLQLHSAAFEWMDEWNGGIYDGGDAEDTDKVSGWSVGPLARARWYFADGALAIGPEIYLKYTSLKYEWDYSENGYSDDFEADISRWDTEYSFRLEMFF